MTPTNDDDLKAAVELRDWWSAFCDADYLPEEFEERMEEAGLIELVPVDDDALDDAFAAERGIVPGGMMWVATKAGRAALLPPAGDQGR